MTQRVFLESPYNGTEEEIKRNVQYAILAMRDSLGRGEAPFVSHLLYTQAPNKGHVSDDDKECVCIGRQEAIDAALSWAEKADKTVVYTDYGISKGMKYGIKNADEKGRPVEYRKLFTVKPLESLKK